jgi:replication factor C small subunit
MAQRGITVRVDGERLLLSPRKALDDDLLARVEEHKSEIMSALAAPAAKMEPVPSTSPTTPSFPFPQSLAEKYRPKTIADFIGLEKPKRILAKLAAQPYRSAWLFVGSSGTGKTTMALALADAINAEVRHIPSQKCTVAEVEEAVRTCHYIPLQGGGFHLVLVDEADRMTPTAQLALLSKLDATAFPPNTIFIFTCNDTGNLESRFLSRCRAIEFSSYGMDGAIAAYLTKVWHAEGGNGNAPDLARLVRESRSNVRNCLMRLEIEQMGK